MTTITDLIEKIDERAEDLTCTWFQPQPQVVPEKIRQALFELAWIRDELEIIRANTTK